MSINMKTIKFGENGEVYAVNAPAVKVSGTLEEANQYIDFGTFENGLTEFEFYIVHPVNTENTQSFFHIVFNDTIESTFLNFDYKNGSIHAISLKKIDEYWWGEAYKGPNNLGDNFSVKTLAQLVGVESITSLKVKVYGSGTFLAGTRYILEGR